MRSPRSSSSSSLLTAGTTFFFERRRERAAAKVARLVVGEALETCWMQLEMTVEEGRSPANRGDAVDARLLPTAAWHEHKAVLAGSTGLSSDDEWNTLARCFHTIEMIRVILLGNAPGAALSDEQTKKITAFYPFVAEVYESLTGSPPELPT